ncbi:hypothetical protein J1N35_020920 [Gossypium stocksii]|uniref:Uncharacterized protein n=1 Tax=Gossypium stocksii TaxID=47602 RepID=A0A9D4A1X5_9ROSI|nr:hypothetical protein J1N35_020920 [Gossypium stocksii]
MGSEGLYGELCPPDGCRQRLLLPRVSLAFTFNADESLITVEMLPHLSGLRLRFLISFGPFNLGRLHGTSNTGSD